MLPDMELEEPCRKAEMRRRIKLTTRRELTTAISQRYRTADRTNKKLILDEFTKVTGYHVVDARHGGTVRLVKL